MVMTSVIYDDILITGRSLDGKMSFKFTAKNGNITEISEEKPADIMAFVKENIFDFMDTAFQSLTNDEELWAEVRDKTMFSRNGLKKASYLGELITDSRNIKRRTKLEFEEVGENWIHQSFSASYEGFEVPYTKYEYDAKVHYHFSPSGQVDDKVSYQLELTTDGKTTTWK